MSCKKFHKKIAVLKEKKINRKFKFVGINLVFVSEYSEQKAKPAERI